MNKIVKITQVNVDNRVKTRLTELGLTVGASILVKKKGIFKSPILVQIKNYRLAIRKSLAEKITVEYE